VDVWWGVAAKVRLSVPASGCVAHDERTPTIDALEAAIDVFLTMTMV